MNSIISLNPLNCGLNFGNDITIYDLNIARNNFANAQGTVAQTKYNFIFNLKLLQFYTDGKLEL